MNLITLLIQKFLLQRHVLQKKNKKTKCFDPQLSKIGKGQRN